MIPEVYLKVNKDTKEILGASLYGKESEELISLIKLAIDQHIPYRDNIHIRHDN